MTQQEFRKWFQGHRAAFVSFGSFYASLSSDQTTIGFDSPESVTQKQLAAAWFDVLADLPFAACVEATKKLARGDEAVPKSWDGHPQAVRRIAKGIQHEQGAGKPKPFGPRTIKNREGEYDESFHCSLCKDWGLVSIIHDETIKAYRAGTYFIDRGIDRDGNQRPKGRRLMTADAICTCEAGARRQHIDARTYDPSRDLLAPFGNEGCDEAIKKFVECPIDAFSEWQ